MWNFSNVVDELKALQVAFQGERLKRAADYLQCNQIWLECATGTDFLLLHFILRVKKTKNGYWKITGEGFTLKLSLRLLRG